MYLVQVMNRTGCRDGTLATEALIENSGDLDQAVDYLLSVALFVGPGDEENLSKTINQNSVDIPGALCNVYVCKAKKTIMTPCMYLLYVQGMSVYTG